jgi:hypothetical protein
MDEALLTLVANSEKLKQPIFVNFQRIDEG